MVLNALKQRFREEFDAVGQVDGLARLQSMAARGSCRHFADEALDPELIHVLCAVALSTPTKSDLQQRDIILLDDPEKKVALGMLVGDQAWIRDAPYILVFCGNNRRQRLLHDWRGHPFANDHLDAMFNAAVDAGIALAGFVTAAEAMGLGCCPISAVRNRAAEVSDLLALPGHVFPVAGLGLGVPAAPKPEISQRLPLAITVHKNTYAEHDLRQQVDAYDKAREATQPYAQQRFRDSLGTADRYGWSEDKSRQYSQPERAGFGEFLKNKGFKLD